MDFDTCCGQVTQYGHNIHSFFDTQHAGAHIYVGGVNRNVERGHFLVDDSFQTALTEAGQSDVITVKEAETVVFVFDVDLVAHALGVLVHETEDALGGAGFEFQGGETVGYLVNVLGGHGDGQQLARFAFDSQGGGIGFRGVVVKVDDVFYGAAVQLGNVVA